jgi:hypothetical protein
MTPPLMASAITAASGLRPLAHSTPAPAIAASGRAGLAVVSAFAVSQGEANRPTTVAPATAAATYAMSDQPPSRTATATPTTAPIAVTPISAWVEVRWAGSRRKSPAGQMPKI